jgi:hypothetical protein
VRVLAAAFERAEGRDGRAGAEDVLDNEAELLLDIVSISGSGWAVDEDDIVELRSSGALLATNGAGTLASAESQKMLAKNEKEVLRGVSRSHGFRGEGMLDARRTVAQTSLVFDNADSEGEREADRPTTHAYIIQIRSVRS